MGFLRKDKTILYIIPTAVMCIIKEVLGDIKFRNSLFDLYSFLIYYWYNLE